MSINTSKDNLHRTHQQSRTARTVTEGRRGTRSHTQSGLPGRTPLAPTHAESGSPQARHCFTSKLYCGSQSSVHPPPTCNTYPIAILLHGHCAIYAPPPTPPVYATHHTILVMAISCKGQGTPLALTHVESSSLGWTPLALTQSSPREGANGVHRNKETKT